ncbi:hypothetical protein C8J56DRAFT_1069725 [Mycena floridula]|nr:hypothetical protein C8J56DRAFT_1069725 [Mycena floridula]
MALKPKIGHRKAYLLSRLPRLTRSPICPKEGCNTVLGKLGVNMGLKYSDSLGQRTGECTACGGFKVFYTPSEAKALELREEMTQYDAEQCKLKADAKAAEAAKKGPPKRRGRPPKVPVAASHAPDIVPQVINHSESVPVRDHTPEWPSSQSTAVNDPVASTSKKRFATANLSDSEDDEISATPPSMIGHQRPKHGLAPGVILNPGPIIDLTVDDDPRSHSKGKKRACDGPDNDPAVAKRFKLF